MDMKYLKKQIIEELDGAKEYAKLAIEIKPMNATWGKTLISMANAEIDHATKLHAMMQELYSIIKGAYTEMPDYIDETYHAGIDAFAEGSAKAKYIIEMYSK